MRLIFHLESEFGFATAANCCSPAGGMVQLAFESDASMGPRISVSDTLRVSGPVRAAEEEKQ
jgi:hypothetical protein